MYPGAVSSRMMACAGCAEEEEAAAEVFQDVGFQGDVAEFAHKVPSVRSCAPSCRMVDTANCACEHT